jgi:DNA-binding phage protein
MMPKSRSYEQELIGYLQDPERAVAYLNAALEEEEEELFLVALQNVAKARAKYIDMG